ncbi:hypothetical protein RP726_17140 [Candidatus Methylospira mobilis]|uniref:hypothetical protein n=1 Tax=Candidatus Methylospira mobilis TaxID=1808979 RepID=UPI001D17A706|nr:hypothetical protein [Candidatus Methylospira mobilis]WNV04117.1 hypothetical protein RP726_17140 [Candidatus Methylospira mobilis]
MPNVCLSVSNAIFSLDAETIATTSGIGYLAMNAREFMRTDVVVLAIRLYSLLGKLADSLARRLETRLLSWHPAYR